MKYHATLNVEFEAATAGKTPMGYYKSMRLVRGKWITKKRPLTPRESRWLKRWVVALARRHQ